MIFKIKKAPLSIHLFFKQKTLDYQIDNQAFLGCIPLSIKTKLTYISLYKINISNCKRRWMDTNKVEE